ncbi:hypothetical protein B0H13DRAFT_2110963 [Mycena leptocephala]|nr:hypothetical protein B0H13DRAFT_2110963 [Mycena leptocephala]
MLLDKGKSESVEEPPPYSLENASNSRSRPLSVLPPLPLEGQESGETPTSFSQIRLDSHWADITGTFYVDPKNPINELTNKGKKSRNKKAIPDAKASVIVLSKSGNITLNLLPAEEARPRFDLEVKSNSGRVVVFLPKTYGGAIQLHTRSGTLEFLPALKEHIHVVKSTDTESLVLLGRQSTPSSQLPSDFCHIRTRSGKVLVGLRGEDTYVEELNLWQRIGRSLKGESTSRAPSPLH